MRFMNHFNISVQPGAHTRPITADMNTKNTFHHHELHAYSVGPDDKPASLATLRLVRLEAVEEATMLRRPARNRLSRRRGSR